MVLEEEKYDISEKDRDMSEMDLVEDEENVDMTEGKDSSISKRGNWLVQTSKILDVGIARGCGSLARIVSRWPYRTIMISLLICICCSIGWISVQDEENVEKLYTPQDTRAFSDRSWVEDRFDNADAVSYVLLNRENSETNLLDKAALLEAMDMYELIIDIDAESGSRGYDLRDCAPIFWQETDPNPIARCQKKGILAFWDWNRTKLEADTNIIATVNSYIKTDCCDPDSRFVSLPSVAAKYEYTDDTITHVGALYFAFYLKSSLNQKSRDDPHARRLESRFDKKLRRGRWQYFKNPKPLTRWGFGKNSSSAFDFDRAFINAAIIAIILYAFFALYDGRRPDRSRGVLGLGAVLCVILSTAAAFGLCIGFGLSFSPSTGIAIFLVLGIGLDDSFVIISTVDDVLDEDWYDISLSPLENDALRVIDAKESIEDVAARRIIHTLRLAGPSITVTSITDAAAFFAGSFGRIPDISNFNKFAGTTVLVDFLAQLTFFVALFTLDQRARLGRKVKAIESKRNESTNCCCCLSEKYFSSSKCRSNDNKSMREPVIADEDASSGEKKKDSIHEPPFEVTFWSQIYPRYLFSVPGKIFVLGTLAVIIALAAVGCAQAEINIDNDWTIVDFGPYRYVYNGRRYQDDHFSTGSTTWVGLYTKRADYYAHRDDMRNLIDSYANQHFVETNSLETNWFDAHQAWLDDKNHTVSSSEEYIESLQLYLASDGLTYSEKVLIDDDGIYATEIDSQWEYKDPKGSTLKRRMRKSRAKVRRNSGGLGTIIVYNDAFVWYESFQVIARTTIFALLVASIVVFIVLILLIGDLVASIMVSSLVALVCASTLGAAYWYNDAINYITSFMIIIAVGLSADAPAHMMKAFLDQRHPTRHERAVKAIATLAPAVFRGGVSTMLGIAITGACITYVFQSFFRYLMTILVLALWNGLAVMPVLCTLIGPMPTHRLHL